MRLNPRLSLGKHVFHGTLGRHLPSILRRGLRPGDGRNWGGPLAKWSKGKLFFATHASTARFCAHVVRSQRYGNFAEPLVILRAPVRALVKPVCPPEELMRDDPDEDQIYVTHAVPAAKLEILSSRGWRPLAALSHVSLRRLSRAALNS